MTADIGSFALDNRAKAQQSRKNVQSPGLTALQGATVAFAAKSSERELPGNTTGKMPSSHLTLRREFLSPEETPSEIPEKGFVRDKIRAFSGSSEQTPATPPSNKLSSSPRDPNQQNPQLLAATRATERSVLSSKSRSISPQKTGTSTSSRPSERPVVPRKPIGKPILDKTNDQRPAPPPTRRISRNLHGTGATDVEQSQQDRKELHADGITARRKRQSVTSISPASVEPTQRTNVSRVVATPQTPNRVIIPLPVESASEIKAQPKESTSVEEDKPKLPPRPKTAAPDARLRIPAPKVQQEPTKGNVSDPSSTLSSRHPSVLDLTSLPPRPRHITVETADSSELDEEKLANAIVASSLASTRASSPRAAVPPVPPHRRSRSRSLLNPGRGHWSEKSRTPSPQKQLRQTLRDHSGLEASAEEEPRVGRKHYIRSHPHKHHEGDRKRWRKEVTERERKRYEGVWAANRGLWITSEVVLDRALADSREVSNMVLNLVVRDIWSRSRLPNHVLEQIWALVDRQGVGLLSREEFVVGMWLIDQQLRGHKLPVKVPESVWESVRHIAGLKVPV